MSTTVGTIDLELLLNSKEFGKQLKNVNGIANNTSNTISNSLSKIGKVAIAAFSVKKIIEFGKSCIDLGSDLAEVQNVVDVSFATMSESVNEFAQNAIEQFGLGQTVTKKYMGTFGAMSKAFGFAEKEAYEMSKTLTGLSGDVASFYNLSSDEAYTKLKSVFTGETESLKDLGVVMTQNALDQYALANGYGKTTSAMSEQEKVALRYKFVTEQLSLASGDFVRTQDSWANQTRVLTLRFQEFKATIGQGIINIFTPVIKVINTVLAKLQVLANAFKSFTEFITGNKNSDSGVGGIATDLSSVTSNADSASNAVGGIGSSAKKAAKDMKSLMGFDTAQILKTDSDSDSGSSGSGAGGGSIDFGSLSDLSSSVEESTALMNPYIEKLRELSNIFKKGFEISFGDTNFDGILFHLKNIKKSILDIFYNQKFLNAAQTWANTTTYALGQMVGAVSRIGVNIAEGLVGSIDLYFSKNSKRIQDFIIKAFYISKDQFLFLGAFFEAVGEISDVFKSDTAKQIGADIIAIFANPFMSVLEIIGKFITDVEAILVTPIIDNVDKIKLAIENTLQPIKTVTDTLAECFTFVGDKWVEVYDEHIHPLLDSIKTGLSDTFSKFLDVYNQYVAPALQRMADRFKELYEQHLKPFLDSVGGLIGSLADLLKAFWEQELKPIIDWIVQNIVPVIVPIVERIWNIVCDAIADIVDTATKIINTVKNIISFITMLENNWKNAWDNIHDKFADIWEKMKGICSKGGEFFDGIKEGVLDGLKSLINKLITGINKVIKKPFETLNKSLDKIRGVNILGAKPFGNIGSISVPEIPYLANGGYFKANQPTLAVVGDNKRQSEIVSPMNKMEEAFENVLARKGLGANKEIVELLKVIIDLLNKLGLSIIIDLDGEELSYRLKKIDKQNEFCRNGG